MEGRKKDVIENVVSLIVIILLCVAVVSGGIALFRWVEQKQCTHVWNDGEITRVSTCEETGELVYTCKECGAQDAQEIEPLGHVYVAVEAKSATCEEEGVSAGNQCEVCGGWEEIPIITPALGHSFTEHEGKAATCIEDGWEAYEACSQCSYTTYQEIKALGHEYVEGGCSRCEVKEHECAYTSVIDDVPASCISAGKTVYACEVCGSTLTKTKEMTGHSYNEDGLCTVCLHFGIIEGTDLKVGDDLTGYSIRLTCTEEEFLLLYEETSKQGISELAYITLDGYLTDLYVQFMPSALYIGGYYQPDAYTESQYIGETLTYIENGTVVGLGERYTLLGECIVAAIRTAEGFNVLQYVEFLPPVTG